MRTLSLADMSTSNVAQYGSQGFGVLPLAATAHVVFAKLAPGGTIGRHPAVADQCVIVVAGDAEVSGEDGVSVVIRTGSAALWSAGESHETSSRDGLSMVIIEGEGVVEVFG